MHKKTVHSILLATLLLGNASSAVTGVAETVEAVNSATEVVTDETTSVENSQEVSQEEETTEETVSDIAEENEAKQDETSVSADNLFEADQALELEPESDIALPAFAAEDAVSADSTVSAEGETAENKAIITGVNGTCPWTYDEDTDVLTIGAGSLSNNVFSGVSTKKIKKVVFSGATKAPTSMLYFFYDWSFLEVIEGIEYLDTSAVTDMTNMFGDCSKLTSLDLSHFNTSAVTNMSEMFDGCSALTNLDLSSFNTSAVKDMNFMFSECSELTSLDLSHFNTSAVTSMVGMFSFCSKLTDLELSSFNTSAVTYMADMFWGCSGLTSLDLSSFNTSAVTNMSNMFGECSKLTALDLSNFNTSAVTDMVYMFSFCSELTSLNLSSFNTSAVTDMEGMFRDCPNLSTLKLGMDFSFLSNAGLPPVLVTNGRAWVSLDNPSLAGKEWTSDELIAQYDGRTMAGTFVWKNLAATPDYQLTANDFSLTLEEVASANDLDKLILERSKAAVSDLNGVDDTAQVQVLSQSLVPMTGDYKVLLGVDKNPNITKEITVTVKENLPSAVNPAPIPTAPSVADWYLNTSFPYFYIELGEEFPIDTFFSWLTMTDGVLTLPVQMENIKGGENGFTPKYFISGQGYSQPVEIENINKMTGYYEVSYTVILPNGKEANAFCYVIVEEPDLSLVNPGTNTPVATRWQLDAHDFTVNLDHALTDEEIVSKAEASVMELEPASKADISEVKVESIKDLANPDQEVTALGVMTGIYEIEFSATADGQQLTRKVQATVSADNLQNVTPQPNTPVVDPIDTSGGGDEGTDNGNNGGGDNNNVPDTSTPDNSDENSESSNSTGEEDNSASSDAPSPRPSNNANQNSASDIAESSDLPALGAEKIAGLSAVGGSLLALAAWLIYKRR